MQISLETAKKLNWLWKEENKIEWIQTFIKIADKEGDLVPFILTDEQRKLVENLGHQNIISKSRQLGISVVTVALSIRTCIVNDNTNCVLISHEEYSCFSLMYTRGDDTPARTPSTGGGGSSCDCEDTTSISNLEIDKWF